MSYASRIMFWGLLVGVGLGGAGLPVQGQQLDPQLQLFSVTNVAVDERARDAVEARTQGIEKAEQLAFEALVRKLAQPEDAARLPTLSRDDIQRLIFGLEIDGEQTAPQRYVARITVRFQPDAVSAFLTDLGMPHVRSSGRPVTVLHAHRRGLNSFAFAADAAVRNAQAAQDVLNRIRLYRFAEESQGAHFQFSVADIAELRTEAIQAALDRFPGQDVLLISSEYRRGGVLRYQYRFSADTERGITPLTDITADAEDTAIADMYSRVFDEIDSLWRSGLLIDGGATTEQRFWVESRDVETFHTIKATLDRLPLIDETAIDQLGVPISHVTVRFRSSINQLSVTLAAQGVILAPYGTAYRLTLAPKGRAS